MCFKILKTELLLLKLIKSILYKPVGLHHVLMVCILYVVMIHLSDGVSLVYKRNR